MITLGECFALPVFALPPQFLRHCTVPGCSLVIYTSSPYPRKGNITIKKAYIVEDHMYDLAIVELEESIGSSQTNYKLTNLRPKNGSFLAEKVLIKSSFVQEMNGKDEIDRNDNA